MDYQNKLQQILAASGLSQESLSTKIGVSFVTLNSWVNGRSTPTRADYLARIDQVYAEIIGATATNPNQLTALKRQAIAHRLTARRLLENRPLLDKITLNLTYHTDAIEGSTMTKMDVSEVIFDNKVLKNRTATEQREAINHQTALHFLLDELTDKARPFTFTPALIRAVHLRLMNGIISDAGTYRNHSVRIMGSSVALANFIKIPELLLSLCSRLNEETTDPIGLLAHTHADFEQIHPFSDGNGRTGRLIIFAKALTLGILPPIIERERKSAYYKYLEQAQTKSEFDQLEQLLAESILKAAASL
ncbi:Fic family protein [Candidatus Saccharibacteria bacterium]|nr:Fic family protein [Candidatus Saccharibacteria bacterium]